ncbi:hypothetical protein SAMN05216419_10331, partial [Nitrosomonas cryotolerans]
IIPKLKISFGVICFGVQAILRVVVVEHHSRLLSNILNNSKDRIKQASPVRLYLRPEGRSFTRYLIKNTGFYLQRKDHNWHIHIAEATYQTKQGHCHLVENTFFAPQALARYCNTIRQKHYAPHRRRANQVYCPMSKYFVTILLNLIIFFYYRSYFGLSTTGCKK